MNRAWQPALLLIFLVMFFAAGYFVGKHNSAQSPAATQEAADEDAPVHVDVTAVRDGEISEQITAYGSVVADPSDVRVLSVPFESRISRVRATPGQAVTPDTELLTLSASPDAQVAFQDTKNAFEAATKDLQQTQQRFNERLATNQELSQSQQNLQSAKLKLDSLIERGVGTEQHLKAPSEGVVSKADVQEGQIVPAGGPLVEIAAENRIQVKLGVEAEDAAKLQVGQVVHLHRVEGAGEEEIDGHIRVIGNRVDPTSRLVDVIVALPSDAHLMLESFVVGKMDGTKVKGVVISRQAILAEEDGAYSVFTIADGHAAKHTVHVGAENDDEVQIITDDVKAGDQVATIGSLELDDGAAVVVNAATTESTTEPTTTPTTGKDAP